MSVLIVGLVNPSVRTQLFTRGLTIGNMLMGQISSGTIVLPNGISADADEEQEPISDEIYYIVVDKCTECKDFMRNPNVPLFVLWIAVCLMRIMWKQKRRIAGETTLYA